MDVMAYQSPFISHISNNLGAALGKSRKPFLFIYALLEDSFVGSPVKGRCIQQSTALLQPSMAQVCVHLMQSLAAVFSGAGLVLCSSALLPGAVGQWLAARLRLHNPHLHKSRLLQGSVCL